MKKNIIKQLPIYFYEKDADLIEFIQSEAERLDTSASRLIKRWIRWRMEKTPAKTTAIKKATSETADDDFDFDAIVEAHMRSE